jgi:hypothetical protein
MSTRFVRATLSLALVAIAALVTTGTAWSQVVTSEIRGTVTGQDGNAIDGVQVIVTDTRTNATFGTLTNASGRYAVLHLQPGGPYTVQAQSIGYRSEIKQGVSVVLSQAATVNFQLQVSAVEVEPLTVGVDAGEASVFSAEHTGQATQISEKEIETFPTRSRNILELTLLSPYVNQFEDAPTIAGKPNRYNNFLVDGAVTNDFFGVGEGGAPGSDTNAKPISLLAVEQMQILVAPFDVRQSNFTGGVINVVTKSGTNEWTTNFFASYSSDALTGSIGEDLAGDFNDTQVGLSFGGPIAKDKVFFFAAGEYQSENRPFDNRLIEEGGDPAEAAEIAAILENTYGVNAGSPGAASLPNPRTNIFVRFDFNLGQKNRIVLRDNYIKGTAQTACSRGFFGYCFTSGLGPFTTDYNSIVAEWFSQVGTNWNNELLINYSRTQESRNCDETYQELTVGSSGPDYLFGCSRFSQRNAQDHKLFQLTDNLTATMGAHRLTFGTSNEFYSFFNVFQESAIGLYEFADADALAANTPSEYTKRVPAPGIPTLDDAASEFNAIQLGFYVQDQWTASDKLTFNFGIRADIPILPDSPRFNPEAMEILNVNTSEVASGNVILQPRFGFNWNNQADMPTQFRGGIGIFAGRNPYVWISNSYQNTGKESNILSCGALNSPGFDPDERPTTCTDGTGAGSALQSTWYMDPDFKFPTDLKISGGIDQALPGGIAATFEILYTKSINDAFFEEQNIRSQQGTDETQGNRPVYGTPVDFDPVIGRSCGDNGGCFTDFRIDERFRQVVELTNQNQNKSLILTFQLQRQFMDWLGFNTSYTFANVDDVQVQQSSQATSNFGRNSIDADPNDPDLVSGFNERPHKVVLAATGSWTFGGGWLFEVTPQYFGQSGLPYSLTTEGDINGDGYASPEIGRDNDGLYIPNNSDELVWKTPEDQMLFDELIASNECLSSQRGSIMKRSSCRYDWNNRLSMQFRFGIPTGSRGRIDFVADVINLFGWEWREGAADRGVIVTEVDGGRCPNPSRADCGPGDDGAFIFDYIGPEADSEGRIDPAGPLSPESRTRWQIGIQFAF